ncbi:hypothetical protein [Paenibacillus nasutitermitis]|uniref:hypothetical protein n=1 Tax=Paenibacillus nasutitermitis TaxID=1652958 RepID=UPI0016693EA5|nr:hypothetical protein [Paenibacillus nasutitermitis]
MLQVGLFPGPGAGERSSWNRMNSLQELERLCLPAQIYESGNGDRKKKLYPVGSKKVVLN